MKEKNKNYLLMAKAIFFLEEEILAFGDLHIGYGQMLEEDGLLFQFSQLENTKRELLEIFNILKKEKLRLKKIIILGDLKHYFSFKKEENFYLKNFLDFIKEHVKRKNIIIIKGNHEKIEIDKIKYKNFYIEGKTAFIHGDKIFPEILNKKIKRIVMGHIHPAVFITEKNEIKKEKYKCFLIGKWKGIEIIIVPSFFQLIEGTDIIHEENLGKNRYGRDFSVVPKKNMIKFHVFVIGKEKIYPFGKMSRLNQLHS